MYHHHEYSAQGQALNFKLRNQDCSYFKGMSPTANSETQAAVSLGMDRCFPHTTLSLASEQTLKDLKRSQGHQRGGEESGFGELGPPDFTEIHHMG